MAQREKRIGNKIFYFKFLIALSIRGIINAELYTFLHNSFQLNNGLMISLHTVLIIFV